MPLTNEQAVDQVRVMLGWRKAEESRLTRLYDYIRGQQRTRWLASSAPAEARALARIARVNVLGLVVDSITRALYVDGYRSKNSDDEAPAWDVWQANGLDARQMGVHRAGFSYDVAYVTVLPGDPVAVIRGVSPRDMTCVYGEDDDWPLWALEKRRSAVKGASLYRLYDEDSDYWVQVDLAGDGAQFIERRDHGLGVVPVVRFNAVSDLDDEVRSPLEDLITIQDQIDFTTFGLLVTQHYGAFPQKWISGWTPEDEDDPEAAKRQVGANKALTFTDPDVKIGQLEAAPLDGYIESRRDSLRNMAALSQLPAHALRGELVNLSAEALAAAEQGSQRRIVECETMFGESWEQVLALAGRIDGLEADPGAQVRWKDTEARAMAATVDALGKLAQMLQIPVEELWEKVPGATQQDIERWKTARAAAAASDPLSQFGAYIDRQASEFTAGAVG